LTDRHSKRERLYTVKEVAAYLRIDPKTVRRLISNRELTAYQVGREWRISERDLQKYLSERWSG
jgi:excisionase family DNA binding protein